MMQDLSNLNLSSVDEPTQEGADGFEFDEENHLTESHQVLLCLDYLRDLRRSFSENQLIILEGIDPDYLSVAIYALNRCFLKPPQLLSSSEAGNDPWFEKAKADITNNEVSYFQDPEINKNCVELPSLNFINKEILYSPDPENSMVKEAKGEEKKEEKTDSLSYTYDDTHPSNSHRFYHLNGLGSGQQVNGPLTLGEIAAAGLSVLGARSRLDAERDMIKSPLFEQFVEAVRAKGFFYDPDTDGKRDNPEEESYRQRKAIELYEERYRKVVAKFRTKLAIKAEQDMRLNSFTTDVEMALSAASRQRRYRDTRVSSLRTADVDLSSQGTQKAIVAKAINDTYDFNISSHDNLRAKEAESVSESHAEASLVLNNVDLEEAEKMKLQGNAHMQRKEYREAADAYTAALKLSPSGPQSHVYFSNRAASYLSMKMFHEAVMDSERSLLLKPDYGKAHARLGLAHFLLGNYRQAVEAYTVSLKYDPDNKSSRSYLEKASRRLARKDKAHEHKDSSFSVVSEWEKPESLKSGRVSTFSFDNEDCRRKIIDEKEAEKYKMKGNTFMASKDYLSAVDAYTTSIDLCSEGKNSHVYFSNRAAALCYLERYEEAEEDSLKSLALNPSYGKAHARLGLSRFFMGDFEGAVQAYTDALKYDPDSTASKSYLAKAKARLDREKNTLSE
jgi:tetratricopeptide (TPR) repeat protein